MKASTPQSLPPKGERYLNQEINFLPYLLLFLAVFLCYFPFTGSVFLFDDIPNLSGLSFVNSLSSSISFITSGTSGPTGRPVALLTFALQHNSWPNQPNHFQLVNIALHGINTVLVFILARLVLSNKNILPNIISEKGRYFAALAIALLWGLHPGNISSVLYIVQRMNLLAVFWGLIALIIATTYLINSNQKSIKIFSASSIASIVLYAICLLLSVFSKENGILFGGLLLVVYFSSLEKHHHYHRFLVAGTLLLLFTLCILLFWKFDELTAGYSNRSFSLKERLLTQPLITLQYIYWFFFPDAKNYYFFHDNVNLITGFQDRRFALSIIMWIALLLLTRLGPLYRLAIGWFLFSHLLESTIFALAMVFEHRNYLSGIGLAFLTLAIINDLIRYLKKPILYIFCLLLISVYITQFLAVAQSWSSKEKMTNQWSLINPKSTRLMGFAGDTFVNNGQFAEAASAYKKISDLEPDSIQGELLLLRLKCLYQEADFNWDSFFTRLNNTPYSEGYSVILAELISLREAGQCKFVENSLVWSVIQAIKEHKHLTAGKQMAGLGLLEARLCYEVGDYQCFIKRYENAALNYNDMGIKETLYRVYGELYGKEKLSQYKAELENKIINP